ncbi:MAG: hypothetical protein GY754_30995 [bacterium]|nr:hypothetical protein [bacterium]
MKTLVFRLLMPVFISAIIITVPSAKPITGNYTWGVSLRTIEKSIPKKTRYVKFTPNEQPQYKNRIMSYITSIDSRIKRKIVILRVNSKPRIDYLFVKNKLYTTLEDWGYIDPRIEKKVLAALARKFKKPDIKKDSNLSIYSYKNKKSKVLIYKIHFKDGTSKFKVYYYNKSLFRMLMLE